MEVVIIVIIVVFIVGLAAVAFSADEEYNAGTVLFRVFVVAALILLLLMGIASP